MTKVETSPHVERSSTRTNAARRWATVVALMCAFIAGLGVGTGVTMQVMRHEAMRMFRKPEDARREYNQRLRSKLALSDEQYAKIETIVNRRLDEFESLRLEVHPRISHIFEEMDREVAAELTPAQQPAFDKFIEERQRMFPPPPPPPGPKPPGAKPPEDKPP